MENYLLKYEFYDKNVSNNLKRNSLAFTPLHKRQLFREVWRHWFLRQSCCFWISFFFFFIFIENFIPIDCRIRCQASFYDYSYKKYSTPKDICKKNRNPYALHCRVQFITNIVMFYPDFGKYEGLVIQNNTSSHSTAPNVWYKILR